jgi:hypothetical protein
MTINKYGRRFWAVYDEDGRLVVVCLYKKGAREVVRRLTQAPPVPPIEDNAHRV